MGKVKSMMLLISYLRPQISNVRKERITRRKLNALQVRLSCRIHSFPVCQKKLLECLVS